MCWRALIVAVSLLTAWPAVGEVYWDDLRAPATGINPPGAEADPDIDTTVPGLLFDKAATETVHIILQVPHDFACRDGVHCEVCPHVHWEPVDGDGGNVLWRLSWRWRNNGEALGDAAVINVLAAAGTAADTLQIDGFACLSKSDATASSIFEGVLSRIGGDASDTYDDDARLKEFDLHYKRRADKPGTVYEYFD